MKEKDIKNQKTEAPAAEETAEKKAEAQGELFPERSEVGDDKYIEALEEKLGQCIAENNNAKNMAMRLQADFDNYKKRTGEQLKKVRDEGVAEVMERVLPIADVIDNALGMIKDENVSQGVKMISRELENVMSAFGVSEIKALGKPFDPELHEAILRVHSESEASGTVTEVFRKGYAIGDKVLRHSVVKVAE